MAFCGKCGTQIQDGAKFCPKCGNTIGGVNQVSQQVSNVVNEKLSTDEENESLSLFGKIISLVIPIVGAILAIVYWVKGQKAKAKVAIICAVIGFAVGYAIQDLLSPSADEIEETAVEYSGSTNIDSDVAQRGYDEGYEDGFNTGLPDEYADAHINFNMIYGTPSTPEEKRVYKIFEENYKRGYRDGRNAR